MKVSVLEAHLSLLVLALWCVGNFWVHNLNHKDGNFQGWATSRVPEIGDIFHLSQNCCQGTAGCFTAEDWRTKMRIVPRKEGILGFLRIILKSIPNLIFILSPHELSPWLISDDFLPLSCCSQLGTKAMGKIPKWPSQPFPETTCDLWDLAWVLPLLCCLF